MARAKNADHPNQCYSKRLDVLLEISQALASKLDVQEVLNSIVRLAVEKLEKADIASLFLYKPELGVLTSAARHGLNVKGSPEVSVVPGQAIAGRVFSAGTRYIVTRQEEYRRFLADAPPVALENFQRLVGGWRNLHSTVAAPLKIEGRAIGVLSLHNRRGLEAFTEEDADFLQNLANHAAVALENARLYQSSQGYARRLESLHKGAQAVAAAVGLDQKLQTLQTLAESALELSASRLCLILLLNEERQELSAAHVLGSLHPATQTVTFKLGQGFVGTCARDRRLLETVDVQQDPLTARRELVVAEGIHACLAVPMVAGEKVVGVFMVGREDVSTWREEEKHVLATLASDAAVAIENARLLEETQKQRRLALEANRELTHTLERLKETQEHLVQSEKMAAIGKLVSGIAHELNNPLTGVIGFSQLLARKETDEGKKKQLELIRKEAERAAAIVYNLGSFARTRRPEKRPVDVGQALSSMLELKSYELRGNNIQLNLHIDKNLPRVMADESQLQQIFLNLTTNAEDVMLDAHGQGTLTIEATAHNGSVEITFQDDGPGIPVRELTRIVDPFFTTKPVGRGPGLGLSICYGIVQEHGGNISATSRAGRGTKFTVTLPAMESAELSATGADNGSPAAEEAGEGGVGG